MKTGLYLNFGHDWLGRLFEIEGFVKNGKGFQWFLKKIELMDIKSRILYIVNSWCVRGKI